MVVRQNKIYHFMESTITLGLAWKDAPRRHLNALQDMPILGSSNSAANKDMMSKIWTNGDTII